ncbi:unnamed protein product, partial [Closterium sp. Naga37s-1]
ALPLPLPYPIPRDHFPSFPPSPRLQPCFAHIPPPCIRVTNALRPSLPQLPPSASHLLLLYPLLAHSSAPHLQLLPPQLRSHLRLFFHARVCPTNSCNYSDAALFSSHPGAVPFLPSSPFPTFSSHPPSAAPVAPILTSGLRICGLCSATLPLTIPMPSRTYSHSHTACPGTISGLSPTNPLSLPLRTPLSLAPSPSLVQPLPQPLLLPLPVSNPSLPPYLLPIPLPIPLPLPASFPPHRFPLSLPCPFTRPPFPFPFLLLIPPLNPSCTPHLIPIVYSDSRLFHASHTRAAAPLPAAPLPEA